MSKALDIEVKVAKHGEAVEVGAMEWTEPSVFICPDCHGTLLQWQEGPQMRYRCHTGHAFSLNELLEGVTKSVGDSLCSVLRVVEESETLLRHMGQHLRDAGQVEAAQVLQEKELDAKIRTDLIRQAVLCNEILNEDIAEDEKFAEATAQAA